MDYRTELVVLVEAFCAATERSEARIANLAGRDGQFFARIRDGKGCSVDTLDHLRAWFSANWPQGKPWPEGIERCATESSASTDHADAAE